MSYKMELSSEAVDDLQRLDKAVAQRILKRLKWFSENFDTLKTEALTADLKGLFKFRVGSYRVVYEVKHKERLLTVHLVAHRKDIYRRK